MLDNTGRRYTCNSAIWWTAVVNHGTCFQAGLNSVFASYIEILLFIKEKKNLNL